MSELLYRFYPIAETHWAHSALRLSVALAEQYTVKLEKMLPVAVPAEWKAYYPLLNQRLQAPQVVIHQGPARCFKALPTAWNIFYSSDPSDIAELTAVNQVDEVWVYSEPEQKQWVTQHPQWPVTVVPPLLDPSVVQQQAQTPCEIELSPNFKFFCAVSCAEAKTLEPLLTTFLLAFGTRTDVSLVLKINALQDETLLEQSLNDVVQAICQQHQIPDLQLDFNTLIGTMPRSEFLALMNQCQAVVTFPGALLALEAAALGKNVLATEHPLLQDTAIPLINWSHIPQAVEQLRQMVTAPQMAPPIDWQVFAPSQVLPAVQERLKPLFSRDLSDRRIAYERQLKARKQYQREGRKQKYSLFHSDYGTAEMASRRQWHLTYALQFKDCIQDVVDVGCGSGLFLEILRDLFIPGIGLDLDPEMVTVCQELGLRAEAGDERSITKFGSESLGGIHASHIIEHVDGERAIQFLENACDVLVPGGILVVRTPNWRNEIVRHEGFWLDSTHIRPYPLPLLQEIFQDLSLELVAAGFEQFGWNDTYIVGRKPAA